MKKLVILFCAGFVLSACNNDLDEFCTETEKPSVSVKTVFLKDGEIYDVQTRVAADGCQKVLSFANEVSLQNFKAQLEELADNAKADIVADYGIRNLHDLAADADDELEELGNKATSESEFRQLYSEYVKKYDGILLNNYLDDSDLTLYVPDGDNVETYIGNENGLYVVNNQVRKINVKNTLPDYIVMEASAVSSPSAPSMLMTRSSTTSSSYNSSVYSPKRHKRVYFNAYMAGDNLKVKMHAKKKMWYGWKNDPARSYYFDSYLSANFNYLSLNQNGVEVISPRLPRYIFNKNVKNGFDIILGRITSGTLTGKFYTWTDMTSEHDANGKELTEIIDGYQLPKCPYDNAHIININLSRK